jgi:hypothetical protein
MGCIFTGRPGAPQEQRFGLEAGVTSARCGKLVEFSFYLLEEA